jgi:hypothetical protein
MRNPKKGDRCEFAVFNRDKLRKERVRDIRHLEGVPPGLLMPVKQDRETVLMCSAHTKEFLGDWSGAKLATKAVKRQKKGHKDAEQEVMFQ